MASTSMRRQGLAAQNRQRMPRQMDHRQPAQRRTKAAPISVLLARRDAAGDEVGDGQSGQSGGRQEGGTAENGGGG